MFESFQQFLPKIENKLHLKKTLDASRICYIATKILNEKYNELAQYINVISFQNGKLKIRTKNPVISTELLYQKSQIIALINEKIGTNQVTDLIILTSQQNSLD